MSSPPRKVRKLAGYVLNYWGGIPGRGEYVRLAFEYAGQPYSEVNEPKKLMSTLKSSSPPHFAPPMLELPSGRLLSQTPAILNHIAPLFGLAGEKGSKLKGVIEDDKEREEAEEERSIVNQLVLTALDLCNEAHDVHHPIASSLYYEDQKPESLRRAEDFRATRIPKFLQHFEDVIASNEASDEHLVGATTTTADLTLLQVILGLEFALPKRMSALKKSGKYDKLWGLKESLQETRQLKEYLESDRRQKFSMGLFRHYDELDGEE